MSQSEFAFLGDLPRDALQGAGLDALDASKLSTIDLMKCSGVALTPHGLSQLRRWRMAGLAIPAVIITHHNIEERRAVFEPVTYIQPSEDIGAAFRSLNRGTTRGFVRIGPLKVDLETRVVHGGKNARLTVLELELLAYLAARRGRVIGRDELLREVWGYDARQTNVVPVLMGRLRRKLGENPRSPTWLQTVHGAGYRLVAERDPDLRVAEWMSLKSAGVIRLSGPPGIGKSFLAERLRRERGYLLVDLQGVSSEAEALTRIAIAANRRIQRLDQLPKLGVPGLVFDPADGVPESVLEALIDTVECPVVLTLIDDAHLGDGRVDGTIELQPLSRPDAIALTTWTARDRDLALTRDHAKAVVERVGGNPRQLLAAVNSLETLAIDEWLATPLRKPEVPPSWEAAVRALSCFQGAFCHRVTSFDVNVLAELQRLRLVRAQGTRFVLAARLQPTDHEQRQHQADVLERAERAGQDLRGSNRPSALALLGLLELELRQIWSVGAPTAIARSGRQLSRLEEAHGSWATRYELATRTVERSGNHPIAQQTLADTLWFRDDHHSFELYEAILDDVTEDRDVMALRIVQWACRRQSPEQARAMVERMRRGAGPPLRLRLRERLAWLDQREGVSSEAVWIDVALGVARQLVDLDVWEWAAQVAMGAIGSLRLTDPNRAARALRDWEEHLEKLPPLQQIHLLTQGAEVKAALEGVVDEQRLELAMNVARRWDPSSRSEIRGIRGTLLLDTGQFERGRDALRENLEWARVSAGPTAVTSVLLDLVGAELLLGDVQAAEGHVVDLRAVCPEAYSAYLWLEEGSLRAAQGRWEEARDLFDEARRRGVNPACSASLSIRGELAARQVGDDPSPWRTRSLGLDVKGLIARDLAGSLALLDGHRPAEEPHTALVRLDRLLIRTNHAHPTVRL